MHISSIGVGLCHLIDVSNAYLLLVLRMIGPFKVFVDHKKIERMLVINWKYLGLLAIKILLI